MIRFQRILKILGLVFLMVLASFGIFVPINFYNRPKDKETFIELRENENDDESERLKDANE